MFGTQVEMHASSKKYAERKFKKKNTESLVLLNGVI